MAERLTITIRCTACVRVLAVFADVPADGSAEAWLVPEAEALRERHRGIHPECKGKPTFTTREPAKEERGA